MAPEASDELIELDVAHESDPVSMSDQATVGLLTLSDIGPLAHQPLCEANASTKCPYMDCRSRSLVKVRAEGRIDTVHS